MARGKLTWTANRLPPLDEQQHGVRTLTVADIGVVFQPIVDTTTGVAFAHEALVRCKRPEYTPPPVLFEHAVKEGACGRLGRFIRDVAFSTCGDVALFVNLHPEELAARWLVRTDDPIGFHSRPVYLEITESATFTYFELCQSVLKELCVRTGALLVVDDFGAGYSNLERLAQLEPAIVKLDLAVIRDIHLHPRKQVVTRHMVSLCRELKARVVAEGVEQLDELKCVRDLGIDFAQGYLLARPAAPPPIHDWPLGEVDARPVRRGAPPTPLRKGPPPLPPVVSKTSGAPQPPKTASGRTKSASAALKTKVPSKPVPRR